MNTENPIFRSLAMIEERIQEKLTVEELASGIHFSRYHYQRMFREAVGESVMGYVVRRKLTFAARELAETDCTVLEVALKYGYDSHEGFTRSFKGYMGVTPTEYRKYHFSVHPEKIKKEGSVMLYSKTTDDMIRELNSLIVEAGETAAYIRKHKGGALDGAQFYAQFWEFTADKAEKMAERLKESLERITAISLRPDEISARFLIIKAIEDTAFTASVTAFHTGLTIARGMPEHRQKFGPLCEKCNTLAASARMRTGKIVDFFNELSALIFQDMRKNARLKLEKAIEAGRAAAEQLSSPQLPYQYIAEEIQVILRELSAAVLEELTVSMLEDFLFRLDTIAFAAETEVLRMPSHQPMFSGISDFKERLTEMVAFFQSLPEEHGDNVPLERTPEKRVRDLAAQENIMLFYLKGELQKLGDKHLDETQKAAFAVICQKIDRAIALAYGGEEKKEIKKLLQEAHDEMTAEAERLGMYGGAVAYLAEAVIEPARNLPE